MKLFGFAQSRSFRALWALEEAALPYEYIAMNMQGTDPAIGARSGAYLALNFQGKVPTLLDGELTLTESAAILNHIARRAPDAKLMPFDDLHQQARYDELAFFVLSDLEQPLWTNAKHRFALPEEQRRPAVLEVAAWEFAKSLRALDQHLGAREFAVAGRFTMIDILVAHTINWADRFKFDVPKKFLELRDRHYARPAAQRALAVIA